MKRALLILVLVLVLVLATTAASAQIALPPGASPQAAQDPGYQALIATCKTPPPPPAARGGGPGGAGRPGGPPAAAATTFPPPPADYTVTEKTMYAVVSLIDPQRRQHAYVYSTPMLAQGYTGRAK